VSHASISATFDPTKNLAGCNGMSIVSSFEVLDVKLCGKDVASDRFTNHDQVAVMRGGVADNRKPRLSISP